MIPARINARMLAPWTALVMVACSEAGPTPDRAAEGERLYAQTCTLCHGPAGEGYRADNATRLRSPTFLATATDAYLRRSIQKGRPGTTMSAWGRASGGPYDDAAVEAIIAYLRSLQESATIVLPTSTASGDITSGLAIYGTHCASCHGATGTEGPNVRLANAEFLHVANDAFLTYAIQKGRPGTTMAAYETTLSTTEIANVVALLRSWAKPVSTGDVPLPGTLGPVVLNQGGPDPSFELGTRYTPADTVKRELDRGASFGFLDARAPSDYVAGHIAGASSVPFYEATKHLGSLPKDKWLVTYCACPHAESGALADTLLQNGFSRVTVLDEGYFVWRDRGYPIRAGAAP